MKDGFGVEPGIWFRLALGGITGHKRFRPRHRRHRQAGGGDAGRRRHRARLHRAWRPHQPQQGAAEICARCLGLREIPRRSRGEARPQADARSPAEAIAPRPAFDRMRAYRRASAEADGAATGSASCCRSAGSPPTQMRGLAEIAREFGDGDIRLTVWQNLLISGVAGREGRAGRSRDRGARACHRRRPRSAPGLVACTGNAGCRFAAVRHQAPRRGDRALVRGARRARQPVNIHLTGCHHSCAQHYIGDIGLHRRARCRSTRRATRSRAITSYVGGGFGPDAALGREIYRDVKARGRARRPSSACSKALSRAPRDRRRDLPRLHAPARSSKRLKADVRMRRRRE